MVTLRDIAKAAGVSTSAVSRAIRDQGNYSEEVRNKIKTLASEMGYKPNINARALVKKQSDIIGFIVPDASQPFYGLMFKGAYTASLTTEYRLMISNYDNDHRTLDNAVESLKAAGCRNIIIHTLHTDIAYLKKLSEEVPGLVVIGRLIPEIQERCVWIENFYAGRLAAEHMLKNGHHELAVVLHDYVKLDSAERLQGIKYVLEMQGVKLKDDNIIYTNSEEAEDIGKQLAQKASELSGVIAFNDQVAIKVMNGLQASGVKIPQDISVIGFDDSIFCELSLPSLTSVKYPCYEMASYAIRLSIKFTNHQESLDSQANMFMPSLIERHSVLKA
ncbi:LacI family DNA-binding transcriptional regulator [Paraglaciecola aquimarina]|uniref:LacI family DNA-binding transcriptional regulator n=1 Tax=Paraglaciecola aquimarina TaxID=1235557 RepID=A0ABU3SXQ6_9ALTE|nr:LacI family DNA-binding transcriptional regulator [Paraglaciecola aquimarina]MDU0354774.1 LacI family DNA-binding transcriptional regulator [Paraglaciecola aquimarina]